VTEYAEGLAGFSLSGVLAAASQMFRGKG